MAAALRCLARKMARAPPTHHRLYSGPGRSSPTPSSPPPRTSIEDPTLGKEDLITVECLKAEFIQLAKAQFITSTNSCVCILLFGGGLYYTFVKPELDELRDRVDSLSRKEKLKKEDDIGQAKNLQSSGGHNKESGGRQG